MLCLSANLCNRISSVAVVAEQEVLFSNTFESGRNQGDILFQHIDAALEKLNLKYGDIDLYAAVTGPGSFTGIRVGIAAVRGLALAAGKPAAGVSSFDLYARGAEGKVLIAIDSLRAELYFQDLGQEPVNILPEQVLDYAPNVDVLAGDAVEAVKAFYPAAKILPVAHADQAGFIALERFAQGKSLAPVPLYVRPPDISTPKIPLAR